MLTAGTPVPGSLPGEEPQGDGHNPAEGRAGLRGPREEHQGALGGAQPLRGSRLPSRMGGGPERPWHLLLPLPAGFCPALHLQSFLFLQAKLMCCLFQEVPLVSMGCSHCLPRHPLLLERVYPLRPLQHADTVCGATDQCPLPLSPHLAPLDPPRQ